MASKFTAKPKTATMALPESTINELIQKTIDCLNMEDPEQVNGLTEMLKTVYGDVTVPVPVPAAASSTAVLELKRENQRLQKEVNELKEQLASATKGKANDYSKLVSVVSAMASSSTAAIRELRFTPQLPPQFGSGSKSVGTWAQVQAEVESEITGEEMTLGELYDVLAPHINNTMALCGIMNGFLTKEDLARVAAGAEPKSKVKGTGSAGNKFPKFMQFCGKLKTPNSAQAKATVTLNASAPTGKAGGHYANVLSADTTIPLGREVSVSALYKDIDGVLKQTAKSASLLWALLSDDERDRMLALA